MIWITLLLLIPLLYLGVSVLYLMIFALSGLKKTDRDGLRPVSASFHKIAVLIPAYKEDAVIVNTVRRALEISYPEEYWDLVVIADSMKEETIKQLASFPIRLIQVSFEKSTKSKALNKALAELGNDYDLAFLLDADNVAPHDVLHYVNHSYFQGYQAIQCHRIAKNTNTSFAVLDAMSEEINNQIFSQGHRNLGLSSRLVGSGMAFDYALFKELMSGIDAIGGFDKELELKLLGRGIEIAYLADVPIWDEKVSEAKVFARQRSRWIAAQFHYFRRFFKVAFHSLMKEGNVDYFNKAFQMILPPRLLLPGILVILSVVSCMADLKSWAYIWGILLLINVITNLIAIPRKYYQIQYLKSFLSLPRAFVVMVLAMLSIRKANKTFIHTPHTAD